MSEKHIKKLLSTLMHAQDHVSLLHVVSRPRDHVGNKIKKRNAAHDAIVSEFAAIRRQRDKLARACKDLIIALEHPSVDGDVWSIFCDAVKPLLVGIKEANG